VEVPIIEKCILLAKMMDGFDRSWAIAGGWAIDLFLGKETREHNDIEIMIFRQDQMNIRRFFNDWEFKKVTNGKFEAWQLGEWLNSPIHETYAERLNEKIEILLNDLEGENWIYRRDSRIRREVSKIVDVNDENIPFLTPEVTLLYKSKNPRAKDELDFRNTLPHMNFEQKQWLINSLKTVYEDHPWIERLN
jgi:hypothetical protein